MDGRPDSTRALLGVLKGARADPPPVWFMRQAGRYLPEYRSLRKSKGGFLELVYDSEAAAEVTLQPLARFGFDGAILFSDILIVPYAMGQALSFTAGEGPHLAPPLKDADADRLIERRERLAPIYETVRRVRTRLPADAALIGFAGSPWTVATYMVAGGGSREQADARLMAYREPDRFAVLVERIVDMTAEYLSGQIEAGAMAVQLFDSWAGSLAPDQFDRWVIAPTRAIARRIKEKHPGIPIIGFPKGAGGRLAAYAARSMVDCVGLDETVDPVWADAELPAGMPVQGNLDPMVLLTGGAPVAEAVGRIKAALARRPHIFNLGHGISKDTPLAHVKAALEEIRK